MPVLDQLVLEPPLQCQALVAGLRQAVDHVHHPPLLPLLLAVLEIAEPGAVGPGRLGLAVVAVERLEVGLLAGAAGVAEEDEVSVDVRGRPAQMRVVKPPFVRVDVREA